MLFNQNLRLNIIILMDKIWKCIQHDRATEIFCKSCKAYICPECLTTHGEDGKKHELIHIFKYSPEVALPLLDHLLKDIGGKDSEMNMDATEFVETLGSIVPQIKEAVSAHADCVLTLKALVAQIEMYVAPLKQQPFVDRIRKGLTADKKRLEEALKKKDLQSVVSLTKKIEAEGKISGGSDKDKTLITRVKGAISSLADLKTYKELIDAIQLLAFKCQHLRLNQCISDWKCDRKYLSTKMTLTEDGLTYGNQAGNGYPAIIGDTPFDSGILAYEVTPTGLCCSGKEGFGIVELSKYKAKHAADNTTPTVYDDMIGLLHNNVAKNMTVVAGSELRNNEKYVLKADLVNLKMTVKGPGCSLKTDLKADTTYVPCFSCGCRNNKFLIKPIEVYEDD